MKRITDEFADTRPAAETAKILRQVLEKLSNGAQSRRRIRKLAVHFEKIAGLEKLWPRGIFIPLEFSPRRRGKYGYSFRLIDDLFTITHLYIDAGNPKEVLLALWNKDEDVGVIGQALAAAKSNKVSDQAIGAAKAMAFRVFTEPGIEGIEASEADESHGGSHECAMAVEAARRASSESNLSGYDPGSFDFHANDIDSASSSQGGGPRRYVVFVPP